MRRKIFLYIGGRLVDLDEQSFILFNYTQEDTSNPTIVKNSYTQSITLKGTPENNLIFGECFRLDRETVYNNANAGVGFDPTRKTPFAIYNEINEILESGYCKLDRVTRKGGSIDYSVTLYGGLGAFFYSLSYREDGEKRTLADLKYTGATANESELDFIINKDAVFNAWARLAGSGRTNPVWDILNFAPCYNGLPEGSFDSGKALVKVSDSGLSVPSGYSTQSGYALATLARNYTDLETKDLRSYLQRPVIKFSAIIDAISQGYNNGGYQVELDTDFFSSSNPYYKKLYLTLPIINTLDASVKGATGSVSPNDTGENILIPNGGNPSVSYSVNLSIYPVVSVQGGINSNLYLYTEDEHTEGEQRREEYYLNYITYTARGYDANGNLLQTQTKRVSSFQPSVEGIPLFDSIGYFDNTGKWKGSPVEFSFTAQGLSYIKLTKTITAEAWGFPSYSPDSSVIWTSLHSYLYSKTVTSYGLGYDYNKNTYSFQTSETARTGVNISKNMLLSSDKTPADYLLSFCKLFGLVFLYDKGAKKVSILKRSNFFRNRVVDLTKRINTGEDISIEPFVFDTKWYDFGLPYNEGEFATYYRNIYEKSFGLQRVNTGYEFNAETKNLFEGSAFQGGCEVLEKSVCFVDIDDTQKYYPSVFLDSGGKYTLTNASGESEDFDLPLPPTSAIYTYYNNAHRGYDIFTKVQFHNKENEGYEAKDTLLLFSGIKNLRNITTRYAVTDDTGLMMSMNNNTPCWLLDYQLTDTASKVSYMPIFSRYLREDGDIEYSLDLGTPKEIAIPDETITEDSSIYSKCWKKYISDRYDASSKVMTCKVNLSGLQVNEELLRNFYYYEGGIWVLNKIKNHSLTTWDDTECEFIKIQDKDNYLE